MRVPYPVFCRRVNADKEMIRFAAAFASCLERGMIIFLQGPLGAGKTTFVRGALSGFGYEGKVKSPTYALVEPYEIATYTIFHFDFYRVKDVHELSFIGITEYFTTSTICFIEWPENGFSLLPAPDLICYIAMIPDGRELRIEAQTERGKNVLAKLPDQ